MSKDNPVPSGKPTPYTHLVPVRLTPKTVKAIDERRGKTGRSKWIRRIIEKVTHTETENDENISGQL
jgi:hypothetical protein